MQVLAAADGCDLYYLQYKLTENDDRFASSDRLTRSPFMGARRNFCRGGAKPGPYPEMWSGGSSAEGTRMEAPKASTDVGSGEGAFSPLKWCILMHSGARFRPTRPIIAIMMFMTSAEVDFSGGFNPRNPPLNTGLGKTVIPTFSGNPSPPKKRNLKSRWL